MAKIRGIPVGRLFMIVMLAVIGIYLWGLFTAPSTGTCTASDVTNNRHGCTAEGATYDTTKFVIPPQTCPAGESDCKSIEGGTLWIIQALMLGLIVFVLYRVIAKTTGTMTRKDIFSIVALAVVVYFVWQYVIVPSNLLGAGSFADLHLEDIGMHTAAKLGLI